MRGFHVAVMALLAVAVGCSTPVEEEVASPSEGENVSSIGQFLPDEIPLIMGPVSADGTQAIFATPDLGVGVNRVGFVLTSPSGLVRAPAASVTSFFSPGEESEGELKQRALAVFRPWPYGTRGLYTTHLTFDRPGRWRLEVNALDPEGASRSAKLFFEVKEVPLAPGVGSASIRSENRTIRDVERTSQLSTGSLQDPELYQMAIAEAVKSGLPTVVVMASPAFCTNAVCGPQVQTLQELKDKYKGQANFIHVDIYDNPEEIQGDLSKARLSPTVVEWGLPSAEWSFVIDRQGIVSARFEAFATLDELEEALLRVL